jgi:tetratricopeptide (TPR) repeat protein
MRTKLLLIAILAVLPAISALAETPPAPETTTISGAPPSDVTALRQELRDIAQAAGAGTIAMPELRKKLADIVSRPGFGSLTAGEQRAAYFILGVAEYKDHDPKSALATLKMSSQMADASKYDWYYRLLAAGQLSDYDDSLTSLTVLANNWPELLSNLNDHAIFSIAIQGAKISDEREAALLEPLLAKWTPSDPFFNTDALAFRLAGLKLAKQDTAGAAVLARGIGDPQLVIEMRADRRFDPIVQQDPSHFDVSAWLKAGEINLRNRTMTHPQLLEGLTHLASFLLQTGRPQEALDVVDAAIARAAPVGGKPSPFTDYDDEINWAFDARSQALWDLGRFDEAIQEMARGAQMKEDGGVNVSQAINLGGRYDALGRPGDALAAIASVGVMSSFGRMQLEDVRACAYAQSGDAANLKTSLDYIHAHQSDAWDAAVDAPLCANDLDGAAAVVVAGLADARERGEMLLWLQDFLAVKRGPHGELLHQRWLALRARPDVQAALTRVGRVESYPIKSPLD